MDIVLRFRRGPAAAALLAAVACGCGSTTTITRTVPIEEGSDWGNPWCLRREGKACAHVAQPLATLDTHAVVDGIAFLLDEFGAGYDSTGWSPSGGPESSSRSPSSLAGTPIQAWPGQRAA